MRPAYCQHHVKTCIACDELIALGIQADKERIAELEARIRELEARMEWRPIESAPMDGTVIILGSTDPDFPRNTIGYWLPDEEAKVVVGDCGGVCRCPEYDEIDSYWVSFDGGFTTEHPPTHWMPLPDAPVLPEVTK